MGATAFGRAGSAAGAAGVSATGAQYFGGRHALGIVGAADDRDIVVAGIGRVAVHLVRSRRNQGRVAVLQSLDDRGNLAAERAGRAQQRVAAVNRTGVGDRFIECLEVADQRGNGLRVAAAHEVEGLLSKRIGLGDEIGHENRLRIVVEEFRRRVFGIGKRREAADAALRRHIGQIGVALDDIDDVEDVVDAGVCRVGADAGVVDIGEFELELAHDRVGVDAGQSVEHLRVGIHQCLHVRDHGIDVVGNLLPIGVSNAAEDLTGRVIEDHANLREVGVRRVGRCGFLWQGLGRCRWRGCREGAQRSIGLDRIDGIDDVEIAGAQRLFCGGHAAERAGAVRGGIGRRNRGVDVGQDRLNMAECRPGKLPRIDLGQQAVVHRGEIVRILVDAGRPLAALLDRRLSQAAHRRRGGVDESRAEGGDARHGGRRGHLGRRRCFFRRRRGRRSRDDRRARGLVNRRIEIDVAVSESSHCSSPVTQVEIYDMWARSPAGEQDVRTMKDHLASWRHSAAHGDQ